MTDDHQPLRTLGDGIGRLERDLETGEVLSVHHIEPDTTYSRNQQRDPGRWPGSQATD